MARPACLALALLAGLLCRSATAQQGQSSFPQPLAAHAWRYPKIGSHGQAELPAEAPSQPDALTGGSAAPRQAPAGAWGSPAPAPSAVAPAPGHTETWLWHKLAAEETEFVQGMLPLDDNGNTVRLSFAYQCGSSYTSPTADLCHYDSSNSKSLCMYINFCL